MLQDEEDLVDFTEFSQKATQNPPSRKVVKNNKTKAHALPPAFPLCLRDLIIGQQDEIKVDK
jgi:hypothetical protein